MKIYLVTGESFLVPGKPMKPFLTLEAADAEAASMVNILLEETDCAADARPENWKIALADARHARAMQLEYDSVSDIEPDEDGYVEIIEFDIPDANGLYEDAARWRALMASDRIRMMGAAGFKFAPDGSIVAEDRGELHIGMEFWNKHPAKDDPRYPQEQCRRVLEAYVDHIRIDAGVRANG